MDERKSKSINVNTCSKDKIDSKSVHEMDISVNMNKVKYTKDEEPLVIDHYNIELIKVMR